MAGIRGLHVVAGDILRVVAASAQLLSALVKKVNRILITQSKDFINEIDILIIAALLHCSVHICVCRYIYIFTSVFLCFVYDLKIKKKHTFIYIYCWLAYFLKRAACHHLRQGGDRRRKAGA